MKRPLLTLLVYGIFVLLMFISVVVSRHFESIGRSVSLFLMQHASPSVYTNWYVKGLHHGHSYIKSGPSKPYRPTTVVRAGEIAAGKIAVAAAGKAAPAVAEGVDKVAAAFGSSISAGEASASAESASTAGGLEAEAASSSVASSSTTQFPHYGYSPAELREMSHTNMNNAALALGVVGTVTVGSLLVEHVMTNNENNQHRADGEKMSALEALGASTAGTTNVEVNLNSTDLQASEAPDSKGGNCSVS